MILDIIYDAVIRIIPHSVLFAISGLIDRWIRHRAVRSATKKMLFLILSLLSLLVFAAFVVLVGFLGWRLLAEI